MGTDAPEPRSGFALILALDDARCYFDAGMARIVEPSWLELEGQEALLNVATGIEHLAKLTLGLWKQETTGSFPQGRALATEYGHGIETLIAEVSEGIAERARTAGKDYISRLAQELNADNYWQLVVKALDTAANAASGRYRNLGELEGKGPEGKAAHAWWQEAERRALETGPDGIQRDEVMRVRGRLLQPVARWWHLVFRAWQNGLVGPEAQQHSSALGLALDGLPPRLRDFARSL